MGGISRNIRITINHNWSWNDYRFNDNFIELVGYFLSLIDNKICMVLCLYVQVLLL